MTENKRFKNVGKDIFQYGEWYCSAGGEHCADVIAEALNILIDENEQLHSELAEKDIQIDYLKNENKHFQQRNNRQAEQLDNLYNLIEKEDWQTLKGIIQEFQEYEEQLQKEWKCYCE